MESDDPFLQSLDSFLGGTDETGATQPPGFGKNDFMQLARMLFWPSVLAILLVCWAFQQGLAAS